MPDVERKPEQPIQTSSRGDFLTKQVPAIVVGGALAYAAVPEAIEGAVKSIGNTLFESVFDEQLVDVDVDGVLKFIENVQVVKDPNNFKLFDEKDEHGKNTGLVTLALTGINNPKSKILDHRKL